MCDLLGKMVTVILLVYIIVLDVCFTLTENGEGVSAVYENDHILGSSPSFVSLITE